MIVRGVVPLTLRGPGPSGGPVVLRAIAGAAVPPSQGCQIEGCGVLGGIARGAVPPRQRWLRGVRGGSVDPGAIVVGVV